MQHDNFERMENYHEDLLTEERPEFLNTTDRLKLPSTHPSWRMP